MSRKIAKMYELDEENYGIKRDKTAMIKKIKFFLSLIISCLCKIYCSVFLFVEKYNSY